MSSRLTSQNGDLLIRDGSVDTSIKSGIAKAWAGVIAGTGVGINQSLNVSSQTDVSTGNFDYSLTNNASYDMDQSGFGGMGGGGSHFIRLASNAVTTSNVRMVGHISNTAAASDMQHNWMWVGDLA